jgi:hypothetical protein
MVKHKFVFSAYQFVKNTPLAPTGLALDGVQHFAVLLAYHLAQQDASARP